MHRWMRPIIFFVLFLAVATGAPAREVKGNVSLFLGHQSLSDDRLDAAGAGSALELGILANLDFAWPVNLALDLFRSDDDATRTIPTSFPLSVTTEVETLELHVGARGIFRKDKPLRPYVGAGIAWSKLDVKQVERGSLGPGAEFTDTIVDDGDSDVGFWLGGGFLYKFPKVHVGADLRYSDASVAVRPNGGSGAVGLDSGGIHFGAFVGLSW